MRSRCRPSRADVTFRRSLPIFRVVLCSWVHYFQTHITVEPFRCARAPIARHSTSSLCALNNINSQNKVIVKTHINLNFLRSRGVQVFFSFVRGHTEIYGNERADWLAKEATKLSDLIPMSIPKSYHRKVFEEKIISEWNNLYQISNNAHLTKEFIPSI
ncbi:RNase H domain-containing protein [Trichonephila clavipes]|nr:RNase H domain-containing protein [Trichonephila clavipes]